MSLPEASPADRTNFRAHAGHVLQRIRAAMAGILAAIPQPGEIRKAVDLERALGIRRTLAWQVFKIARADDPLNEGGKIPGAGAMKRFFDAAAARGVPSAAIKTAVAALDEFDQFVKTHAGNRHSFVSMITDVASDGAELVDLQQKRAAFRANGHIWGAQAETQLKCCMVQAAVEPAMVDVAKMHGYLRLQRFRTASPFILWWDSITGADYRAIGPAFAREPFEPGLHAPHGTALLAEFCSQPLPELRTSEPNEGVVQTELIDHAIGKKSAVTIVLGDVWRNVSGPYTDATKPELLSHARVRIPTRTLIHDVLIHEGLFGELRSLKPRVGVFGGNNWDIVQGPHSEFDPPDRLAMCESASFLGMGPSVVHTPDVPRYEEMVRYAFERLGWDGERFGLFRCRVEYPVMPSWVIVQFDLPEKPGE